MKVLTILARYGLEQYPTAEEDLDAVVRRQLPGIDRDVIVVDNALASSSLHRRADRTVIGGDNRVREFTAFDRGIETVGSALSKYDVVHLATSAFNTLHTAYLERFTLPMLRAAATRAVCLGHIDCYNEPVRVGSYVSQHWTRTCFFFLPVAQVRALGSFVSIADGAAFFSGEPAAPFRADAPINATYRRYIIDWLTGADIGQGVSWHSRLALTPETLTAFEQKALCILNEQMLGVRLRALGCRLVDVTWADTVMRANRGSEVPWTTPWREQLAHRDRDAIAVG
jgi:hypothetical protein